MRKYIPWYGKIAIKIILARLPVSYDLWAKLGLFKHGQMETASYAKKIYSLHQEVAKEYGIDPKGTYLEMGTGDSIACAIFSYLNGAQKTHLVDVGAFASKDMGFYKALIREEGEGTELAKALSDNTDFSELLELCHAEYHTQGLTSLEKIDEGSVDFIWSHATLEHVRKYEFKDTMAQTYRILKPGGIASHNIDYKDHLGGALNNMRFSDKTWEAEWMAASGFYTNRISSKEMRKTFEACGFEIKEFHEGKFEELPTPQHKMAEPYAHKDVDELLVRGMSIVLKKPA